MDLVCFLFLFRQLDSESFLERKLLAVCKPTRKRWDVLANPRIETEGLLDLI